MHHIAPFVEFDRYNICAAGFIYSSEPVNFPLVLYYNVSWSDKFYMYYHSPLQTFHLSDLKKNDIVSNCMLLSKNPEDLQHYSFVFVLIV